jgi:hypothetical protein
MCGFATGLTLAYSSYAVQVAHKAGDTHTHTPRVRTRLLRHVLDACNPWDLLDLLHAICALAVHGAASNSTAELCKTPEV